MAIEKNIKYEDEKKQKRIGNYLKQQWGILDKPKNKKISYKPNTVSNGHDPYPNVIPIGPIKHEKPWWSNDDDDESKREGIQSLNVFSRLASAKDDFDFYYQVLSKYYSPSDLYGKSLNQLDQMLQMFIKDDGGLI
jgi:hypothetical protein|tara:strand:+ start:1140 stop:1547 length:408 start_codon:yes stop_codon:yes gene_type:complete